jgi:hypothetical protein
MDKQPYSISVEVLDNHMFYFAGMTIDETVMGIDNDNALDELLKIHDIPKSSVKLLRCSLYNG